MSESLYSQPIMGIDIGSHSIKAAVYAFNYNTNEYVLLCSARTTPTGIAEGVCFDRDILFFALKKLCAECERKINQEIEDVCVYITGTALEYIKSRGEALILHPDALVQKSDIEGVIENSAILKSLKNKVLIDIKTDCFYIDGRPIFGRVLGMEGIKLEVDSHLVLCESRLIEDITFCFKSLKKQIQDITSAVYSESLAITREKERRAGCAIIHVGAEATELLVFENTFLIHRALIPVGGNKITEDIALGFACTLEEAEIKKHKQSVAVSESARANIHTMIEARLEDILDLVVKELKKIRRHQLLPGGIILSGGGALSPILIENAKKILKLPVRNSHIESGKEDRVRLRDMRFYVAGSLPYVLQKEDISARPRQKNPSAIGVFLKKIVTKISNTVTPFLP